MGSVVGLWVGCLRVRLGFFFLEFVEVSVLSLVGHCWGGGFLMGCMSVEVDFCCSLYSGLYALLYFLPIVLGALVLGRVRGL